MSVASMILSETLGPIKGGQYFPGLQLFLVADPFSVFGILIYFLTILFTHSMPRILLNSS